MNLQTELVPLELSQEDVAALADDIISYEQRKVRWSNVRNSGMIEREQGCI
ncbi:MAG TPA: hypothetical protein VFA10_16080 [Ktedonobacteraceae bacterium]|nr:hypothetical protein [Ktedonobacteraceae bacterium]